MRDLVERYAADRRAIEMFYDLRFTDDRLTRLDSFCTTWLGTLNEVEFDSLGTDQRIDYILLRNHLEWTRARLAHEQRREEAEIALCPAARTIARLEEARRRLAPAQPDQAAAQLAEIAADLKRLTEQLQGNAATVACPSGETDPAAIQRLSSLLPALEATLKCWSKHSVGYDPVGTWWLSQPTRAVRRELAALKKALAKRGGKPEERLGGIPIGREALLTEIEHEFLPYTPEELMGIAEAELAWCEDQMVSAARELGHGDNWRGALEEVKSLCVPPGAQADLVAQLAREAIDYVESRELVTVEDLCRETWRVDMIDEKGQRRLPYAGYGGQKVLASYPTHRMPHDAKLMSQRANNIHFTRLVTQHELIPGHHLQAYMAQRYAVHRAVFTTPFLIEGWAIHWEMLLWDLGFPRGPEDRIGMLFWRMHRSARVTISLRFHLGETTPEEMVDWLVDRVGHERDAAMAEVRRYLSGDYGPLYQCAYLIGGLQLRALYRETVGAGRLTPREFHDLVLRENAIPIELIRARLLNQELRHDYRTAWRFAS